jgi:hypothetical protein
VDFLREADLDHSFSSTCLEHRAEKWMSALGKKTMR